MPPLPRSSSPNRLRPRMRPQRTPDCTGGLAADGVSAAPDWLGLELGPGIADPLIDGGGVAPEATAADEPTEVAEAGGSAAATLGPELSMAGVPPSGEYSPEEL